jgi:hypothetical protein
MKLTFLHHCAAMLNGRALLMRSAATPVATRAASLLRSSSNRDKPLGPSTTASPSIVKLLASICSAEP